MFRNLSKILPGLLNDLTDWTTSNRIMSAKLLRMLLLNSEDHTTQHMEKLLSGMYRACGDEEREVVQQVGLPSGVHFHKAVKQIILLSKADNTA